MSELQFADILLILVVCAITFTILHLVNRGRKKQVESDVTDGVEDSSGSSDKSAQGD